MRGTRVLGISPGTRRLGLAVIQRHCVFYCCMKSFIRSSWSAKKLESMLTSIDQLILLHDIRHIAVKMPPEAKQTSALHQLVTGIETLAKTRRSKIYIFTLPQLKKGWQLDKRSKFYKKQLKEQILARYNLQHMYDKEVKTKTKTNHYEKAFEAVGVADLVLRKIKKT